MQTTLLLSVCYLTTKQTTEVTWITLYHDVWPRVICYQTNEIIIDFRSGVHHPNPVNINVQNIEIVHSYKCMGPTIGGKLRWEDKTMNLYKKVQQRLYFLRKLTALNIDRNDFFVFHDSIVNNVLTFGLICWWGNLSVKNRDKINRIYTIPCKIAGYSTSDTSLEQLYKSRTLQMTTKVLSDPTHFLHDHYDLLGEIQNANCKNPTCPQIIHSILHLVFEPAT